MKPCCVLTAAAAVEPLFAPQDDGLGCRVAIESLPYHPPLLISSWGRRGGLSGEGWQTTTIMMVSRPPSSPINDHLLMIIATGDALNRQRSWYPSMIPKRGSLISSSPSVILHPLLWVGGPCRSPGLCLNQATSWVSSFSCFRHVLRISLSMSYAPVPGAPVRKAFKRSHGSATVRPTPIISNGCSPYLLSGHHDLSYPLPSLFLGPRAQTLMMVLLSVFLVFCITAYMILFEHTLSAIVELLVGHTLTQDQHNLVGTPKSP